MITQSADKCPLYPVSCLFECLFSAFLNSCMLYFDVIMIKNELCPLMFSHNFFRNLRSLFFLAWLSRYSLGYTLILVNGI